MPHDNLLYQASPESLTDGFVYDSATSTYRCLFCESQFEQGIIYPVSERWMDAQRAARQHVQDIHGGSLQYLLDQGKTVHGLSDAQKQVLMLVGGGLPDKEIAKQLKIAPSTVRNQRFFVREKAKQAKVLLAILALLEHARVEGGDERLIEPMKGATTMDERFVFTEQEQAHVWANFFDKYGSLIALPAREKRKIIALHIIATKYIPAGRDFTEQEINEILIQHSLQDHVTLRRYLIGYGFLDRLPDGSRYWVRNET